MDDTFEAAYQQVMAERERLKPKNTAVNMYGQISDSPIKWKDPDTFTVGNFTGRTLYNAPEIAHNEKGIFTPPGYQGVAQEIPRVLSAQGFNVVKPQGSARYNRTSVELETPQGEKASTFAVKTGLADVNQFTPQTDINARLLTSSYSRLFPELAAQDPTLALVNQYRRKELEQSIATNTPQYRARMNLQSPDQYEAFKKSIGNVGSNAAAKEIKEVEEQLNQPNLPESARALLTKRLNTAREELFYAATTPDYVAGVNFQPSDRNIMNQSNNQFTDAMVNTWYGSIMKGMGGYIEQVGDDLKWDFLKNRGKNAATYFNLAASDLPSTLSNFTDISTEQGAWNTVKDTSQWVFNNLGSMLPYVAGVTASGIAAVSLVGVGAPAAVLSVIPMGLINAGAYYHDQPKDKKNSSLAYGAGVIASALDKIGLHVSLGRGINAFTTTGFKELATRVATAKSIPLAAAKELLASATKREVMALAEFGEKFARSQYASASAMARGAGVLTAKGLTEAGTETTQTWLEIVAKSGDINSNYKYEKGYYDQLLNAAAGGFGLAGVLHAPSMVKDAAQWHSLVDGKKMFEGNASQVQQFQADNYDKLRNNQGGYLDISNMVDQEGSSAYDSPNFKSNNINDLAPSNVSFWERTKGLIKDPGLLLRQLQYSAIPDVISKNGTVNKYLGYAKAIMGGEVLPGASAFKFSQNLVGKWTSMYDGPDVLSGKLGVNKETVNTLVQSAWASHWSKNEKLPEDTLQNKILQNWKDTTDDTRMEIMRDASVSGVPMNIVSNTNALFEASLINPKEFQANRPLVVRELIRAGATALEANDAVDGILSGNKSKASVARDFMAKQGAFTNPALAHLFQNNTFANIDSIKDHMASAIMRKKYIGDGGSVIGKLLVKAFDNGEFGDPKEPSTRQSFNKAATEVKAWVDIQNGNFHSLDDYPIYKKIMGWTTVLAMLSSLGKAALSSQTEVAMSVLGTQAEHINKQVSTYVKELASEIKSEVTSFSSFTASLVGINALRSIPKLTIQKELDRLNEDLYKENNSPQDIQNIQNKIEELYQRQFNRNLFHELGFKEAGYNAQSKFEHDDVNQRKAMSLFVRVIGLEAQTDALRLAALSVGADVMLTHLSLLKGINPAERDVAFATGNGLTKEQQQAVTELQKYGMNINAVLDILDIAPDLNPLSRDFIEGPNYLDERIQYLNENIKTSLSNFVDSKVVNPQAHNLPKYFHDPRLRLVTSMGRFMAAAHAIILPRLYRDYILNGNAGMRYQAFSVIVSTLITGHLMNMLKDMLAYGEDNPYIKTKVKQAQRTLNASGLLGQFEKVVDTLSPLYPTSKGPNITTDPLAWGVSKATGISPQAAWAKKAIGGAVDVSMGDTAKGVKSLVRAAPLAGSFPIVASEVAKYFK
jgi:hypothetical protein